MGAVTRSEMNGSDDSIGCQWRGGDEGGGDSPLEANLDVRDKREVQKRVKK